MGKLIRAWPILGYAALILCIGVRAQYYPPSGGSGGGSVTSGTFASLPACTTNGAIYVFTDSYYNYAFCNGATWSYILNGVAMVPPDLAATFASTNITGSFDKTHGAGVIINPTASVSVSARLTPKPVTSTWHVILAFRYVGTAASNTLTGICTQESGSGKMDEVGQFAQSSLGAVGFAWTNPTTFSGTTFLNNSNSGNFGIDQPMWLRFGQGGGNQTWDYSNDQGVTWINLLTESATARITVDHVGYCTNGANSAIKALHWAVTL